MLGTDRDGAMREGMPVLGIDRDGAMREPLRGTDHEKVPVCGIDRDRKESLQRTMRTNSGMYGGFEGWRRLELEQ